MMGEILLEDLSLWSCMWQSTLLVVIGLAGSFFLRRRPARAFQVLLLAMIAAVVVPALSVLVKHLELGIFVAEPQVLRPMGMDLFSEMPFESSEDMIEPRANAETHSDAVLAKGSSASIDIPWRAILLLGWMTAALALLGRLLIAFVNGLRLIGRSQPDAREHIQQALDRARTRLGISRSLQICASDEIHSPMVWCWSRTAILLVPRNLNNGIDWAGVICHELAHCIRRDHISGLAAELTVCILCWNPLSWLAKKRLVRLGEQACDDWVVAGGEPVENYARSLLNFKPQKQAAFVPAVVHSKKGVAARVRRILKYTCVNPRIGVVWALTVSVLVALIAIGIACAQTKPAKPANITKESPYEPTEPLHKAAADGDIEQVKSLISAGADVNGKDTNGETVLNAAVANGHKAVIELLISKGADVNARGLWNAAPLHSAAWFARKEIAEFLLEKGADVNIRQGDNGWTPLHSAANRGNVEVAKVLIANGADFNAKAWGSTPLDEALWHHRNNMTRFLVSKGSDINYASDGDWPPLYYVLTSDDKQLVELFINKGSQAPALHLAAFRGNLARVKSICAEGTDVNSKDQINWTPLHWAVSGDQKDIAEFLISKGADVNAKSTWVETPLLMAAYAGSIESVKLLLSKGAGVNMKSSTGSTPLHCAAKRGHIKAADILIANGADIEAEDNGGRTPLDRASNGGQEELVRYLIDKGAAVNTSDNWGRTALSQTMYNGHTEIAELLRQHGAKETLHGALASGDIVEINKLLSREADINAKDDNGQTPLHLAAGSDYKEIVEILIAKGADINSLDNYDRTPLYLAVLANKKQIVEMLLKNGADVTVQNSVGRTVTGTAREKGYIEIVELLNSRARQLDQKKEIMTISDYAAIGDTEKIKSLIAAGQDVNTQGKNGGNALLWASLKGHREIAELLIQNGANVNVQSQHGSRWTPLLIACRYGNKEIVELLLANGAETNEKNDAGSTALDIASQRKHTEIVELLKKHGAGE